jgi:hypothetical protein
VIVVCTAIAAIGGAIAGLAINAASASPRWPGPLDLVRQYPLVSAAAFVLVEIAIGVGLAIREHRQPKQAASAHPGQIQLNSAPNGMVNAPMRGNVVVKNAHGPNQK